MTNHVHLLLRELDEGLMPPIKSVSIAYAQYFNLKYERSGHLFQDRFKSEPVNDMGYFVTLLRYIHQNPIAAGIASSVDTYTWSSWCEYDDVKPCALPVCTTQHVFSRISKDDLTALVNDPLPKALNILDFDNETAVRVSDEKVREYLHTICNDDNLTNIQHYPKDRRNDVIRMVKEGVVEAIDGTTVQLKPHSICLHGDSPTAVQMAKTLRARLEEAGIEIVPLSKMV